MPFVSKKRAAPDHRNVRPPPQPTEVAQVQTRMALTPQNIAFLLQSHTSKIGELSTLVTKLGENVNTFENTTQKPVDLNGFVKSDELNKVIGSNTTTSKKVADLEKRLTDSGDLSKKVAEIMKKVSSHDEIGKKVSEIAKKITNHDNTLKRIPELERQIQNINEIVRRIDDIEKKTQEEIQNLNTSILKANTITLADNV